MLLVHSISSRDEDMFEIPKEFRPDRWEKSDDSGKMNPFSSLPFGFGPRGCYGIIIMHDIGT